MLLIAGVVCCTRACGSGPDQAAWPAEPAKPPSPASWPAGRLPILGIDDRVLAFAEVGSPGPVFMCRHCRRVRLVIQTLWRNNAIRVPPAS